jgi:uncharacterized membrane protein
MTIAKRLLANLFTGSWHARRALNRAQRNAITEAVKRAEKGTSAQIRVVVESALNISDVWRGQGSRGRALEVFGLERVWDTRDNTGVLLYILLSERDAQIVADRGFNDRVTTEEWERVCEVIENTASELGLAAAVEDAVNQIGTLARQRLPSAAQGENELSDELSVLER